MRVHYSAIVIWGSTQHDSSMQASVGVVLFGACTSGYDGWKCQVEGTSECHLARQTYTQETYEIPQNCPRALKLTGPKPKETKVETFRIGYQKRAPKVEKLSLPPISKELFTPQVLWLQGPGWLWRLYSPPKPKLEIVKFKKPCKPYEPYES